MLNHIQLPPILGDINQKQLRFHYRYICLQYPKVIHNMSDINRYALLFIFIYVRRQEITDNVVLLFMQLLRNSYNVIKNKIKAEQGNITAVKKTYGRKLLLYKLANACLSAPDQAIDKAIYPIVSPDQLQLIIKEYEQNNLFFLLI